jgi:hypothetical protein
MRAIHEHVTASVRGIKKAPKRCPAPTPEVFLEGITPPC